MSLTNALSRIRSIVQSATSWQEADNKVVDLMEVEPPGADKKYLVRVTGRDTPGLTYSNIRNTVTNIQIQLSRELSGGKNYNYSAVQDDLEGKAFEVIKDIETYTNWDYTNTEIVLINTLNSEAFEVGDKVAVWNIPVEIHIRRVV